MLGRRFRFLTVLPIGAALVSTPSTLQECSDDYVG